jgi:hypothetical protein
MQIVQRRNPGQAGRQVDSEVVQDSRERRSADIEEKILLAAYHDRQRYRTSPGREKEGQGRLANGQRLDIRA